MPTYSYRCTECATAFDIQQAFTDDSLTVCPKCGGKLRKLFHAVGVSFSGTGFYRNDSRAGETKAREKKESAAAESGSGSKEPATASAAAPTKTDSTSKPASKPAAATKSAPAKDSAS
jgi:putative FmdB family regulatory protein